MYVEEIILNKLIKYRNHREDTFIFADMSVQSIDTEAYIINILEDCNRLEDCMVNTSVRAIVAGNGLKGKILRFLKKVARKMVFFYVQPICDQQTIFNTTATQCIEKLIQLQIQSNCKIKELQNTNSKLQEELNKYSVR